MQKRINLMFLAVATLLWCWVSPAWADFTATWTQKQGIVSPPIGPGPRSWIQLPYDSAAQRLVLMGGSGDHYFNDVWHYDVGNDSWTQVEAYVPCESINGFTPPTPRDEHAIAFDSYNNLLWMFGGSGFGCKGDLRTAAAGTSTQKIVDPSLASEVADFYKNWNVYVPQPPYVSAIVTAYDPSTRTLSLNTSITGLSAGSPFHLYPQGGGGTWSYSGANHLWTGYDAPKWSYAGVSPPGRLSGALAYSTLDHALLLFGGESNGAARNDTWVWDVVAKTWQIRRGQNDPASPPVRAQITNAMVYDSANDVFILFGGRCYKAGSCPLGDTWAYKLATNTWTKMNPPTGPSPREQAQIAYDAGNRVVVLYGGAGAGGIYDDLWVYDYAQNQWTQVVPMSTANPGPRKNGALGYDANNRRFVLYGGSGGATSYDVWSLALAPSEEGNNPPMVSLTAPANNTSYIAPANITLEATASDSDGTIAQLEFYEGTNLLNADSSAAHSFNWSNVAAGVYTVTAKATDNVGASTISAPITVTVNTPITSPQLSLSAAPVSGGVNPSASEVTLNGVPLTVNNGAFSFTLPLNMGTAVYTLEASNGAAVALKRITVTVE